MILFPNFCAVKALHLRNCNFAPEPLNGNALKLNTVKLVNSSIQLDRWCALYELQSLEYDRVADSLNQLRLFGADLTDLKTLIIDIHLDKESHV